MFRNIFKCVPLVNCSAQGSILCRNFNSKSISLIKRFDFSSAAHLTIPEAEERILKVLGTFDKIDTSKLSISTPFTQLGLDSLDVVEVMIAIEEEFHMEIPDVVADKVQNPKEVAEYIHSFMNPNVNENTNADVFSETSH